MSGDHDEAMALDPEDVKDDLRAELFVLQSALKALQYPGLDELDKFLSLTYSESADSQIPKLRKQIDRMRRVKALLSEGTTSSSPAPSAHANHKMSRPELSPAPSAVASKFAFRVCVSVAVSGDSASGGACPTVQTESGERSIGVGRAQEGIIRGDSLS